MTGVAAGPGWPTRHPGHVPLSAIGVDLGHFIANTLVDAGGKHLALRQGTQDHAVALKHKEALVIAVADGVSLVNGSPSRTEVGAAIVAELAAHAAADAALRGLGSCDVRQHVAGVLVRHLLPLCAALGSDAGRLLHCTLVLGVTTVRWSTVWCVGDGAWGGTGSLAHGLSSPRAQSPIACYGRRWSTHGRIHTPRLASTVVRLCRGGDADEVAAGLMPVLEAEGPALGLYVATDGIEDEDAADAVLRQEFFRGSELRSALTRPDKSDDIAIAWTSEFLPGFAGLATESVEP